MDYENFRNRNSFWEADFDQEKKYQGTNENHLVGAIFRNFSMDLENIYWLWIIGFGKYLLAMYNKTIVQLKNLHGHQ